MQKTSKIFISLFLLLISVSFFAPQVHAEGVQSVGGTSGIRGTYRLKSLNGGQGNYQPGSSVNVDSYVFQCKSRGTAACSTQWNSDAALVQKWQNSLVVPQLNQMSVEVIHNWDLPFGQCGRVQFDQGIAGLNDAIGGWVYDYGKDCAGSPTQLQQPAPGATCASQQIVDTQLRISGNGAWVAGSDLTSLPLRVGQNIDVNCFAKTGTALLEGGVIDAVLPNGTTQRVSTSPELRNYTVNAAGTYTFTCTSTTISSCSNVDSVNVQGRQFQIPFLPTPTPTPTPTPVPTAQPSPTQIATCDSLQIVSGNDSLVPAKVTLRARGSDNLGNIQKYRFYFGDGQFTETDSAEITHEYTSSGSFFARVDVKDSRGNYRSSSACETTVSVKSSSIESYKAACSNLFITADNNAKAPSVVKFEITGYDNKGDIQGYKIDFGNGIVKESTGRTFEQRYDQTGTYLVRAYIKNSKGEYLGGSESCDHLLVIGSNQPLTRQPSTGMPTAVPMFGLLSGSFGVALLYVRSRLSV